MTSPNVSPERGDVTEGDRGVTPPALRATSPYRRGMFHVEQKNLP